MRIIELCPECGEIKGHYEVIDEAGEDCNAAQFVKAYLRDQEYGEAKKCHVCGSKLIIREGVEVTPSVEELALVG